MGHAPDLSALQDALGCATAAVAHAWRGDRASASLSLIEAHAAAEEAFGCGSPEVDALDVVFAAITQATRSKDPDRPAVVTEHPGGPWSHSRYHERGAFK
jgi:hypothetical protein